MIPFSFCHSVANNKQAVETSTSNFYYKITDLKNIIEISLPDDGVSVFCYMCDCACNTVFPFLFLFFIFILVDIG